MPDGTRTEELRDYELVENYVAHNAKSWYKYVESDDCGLHAENGDIRVVVGMDKVCSWGIATFENVDSEDPLRFEFKKCENASLAGTPNGWDWDGILGGRVGPPDEEVQSLQALNMSTLCNQCVFVRTLNISVSGKVRERNVNIPEIGQTVSPSLPSSYSRSAANLFSAAAASIECIAQVLVGTGFE
jgi:hypothetical protein